MLAFPNCKINIGLNVRSKRPDGYHNLQTIFYPLHKIKDALEVVEAPRSNLSITFTRSGALIPGDEQNNLCVRAYQLLKADFPALPSIEMHLHKTIPMGAGLGGGSSDGAFALKLINDKFDLQLSPERLLQYATALGSDCPFFIMNKPCYATGRGEQLQALSLDLSSYRILVVHPGIHVNTADAFKLVTVRTADTDILERVQQPPATWKEAIINDFEAPVFTKFPEIAAIKAKLYEYGALYASMSGSGSAVYGIFENENERLYFPPHYFSRWI